MPKLKLKLKLFNHALRRLRHLSSSASSSLLLSHSIHSKSPPTSLLSPLSLCSYSNFNRTYQSPFFIPYQTTLAFSNFASSRSFSTDAPPPPSNPENEGGFDLIRTESDNLSNLNFNDGSEVADGVFDDNQWVELLDDKWYDPLLTTVISGIDSFHNFTGLPWWLIIVSSTLALRAVLFPLLILQLKKMKKIGELLPKLPPPYPLPDSEKSYVEQFMLFSKEKKAVRCPSSLWILASASVQVPGFFLLMASIRRLCLDHHPGFDCGGILWFQNLTESPNGVLAPIFPLLIAGLHYLSIQISFQTSMTHKETTLFSSLKKSYKHFLDFMTIPTFIIGFWIPQGSLLYWFTNSSLTVIQQVSLSHPVVREKLGLSNMNALAMSQNSKTMQNLSPDGLLSISLRLLADGHKDRAVSLLRLALEKDPEYVRGLVVLGQTLMQQEKLVEATEYLERAISKLTHSEYQPNDEEVDLLILASSWAGLTCILQKKTQKGLEHLKRITELKEPQDPKGKGHYYEGFVLLSSALYNVGQKDEAAGYLRRSAAYDPAYNDYLRQCLEDEGDNSINAKS